MMCCDVCLYVIFLCRIIGLFYVSKTYCLVLDRQ